MFKAKLVSQVQTVTLDGSLSISLCNSLIGKILEDTTLAKGAHLNCERPKSRDVGSLEGGADV